jgi:hypothetical protein
MNDKRRSGWLATPIHRQNRTSMRLYLFGSQRVLRADDLVNMGRDEGVDILFWTTSTRRTLHLGGIVPLAVLFSVAYHGPSLHPSRFYPNFALLPCFPRPTPTLASRIPTAEGVKLWTIPQWREQDLTFFRHQMQHIQQALYHGHSLVIAYHHHRHHSPISVLRVTALDIHSLNLPPARIYIHTQDRLIICRVNHMHLPLLSDFSLFSAPFSRFPGSHQRYPRLDFYPHILVVFFFLSRHLFYLIYLRQVSGSWLCQLPRRLNGNDKATCT